MMWRESQGSSVRIPTGYGLDDRSSEVRFPAKARNVSLLHRVQAQRPTQGVPVAISVKRPGHEADHSPPPSAVVKEFVALFFHPQYIFLAWCSVKHSDFTFLPYLIWRENKRVHISCPQHLKSFAPMAFIPHSFQNVLWSTIHFYWPHTIHFPLWTVAQNSCYFTVNFHTWDFS
jgi:hypothetical protein